jgi:lipopolysaccharide export system protein LptA
MNTVHRKAAVRFVSCLIVSGYLSGLIVLLSAQQAWCLSSYNDQLMDVTANTSKSVASKTGAANDPDITDLDGNVIITRGSIKILADHARVYQIPSGANDPNAGKYSPSCSPANRRTCNSCDGDCGLMSADANIDYKPPTNLAELTGNVKVVQAAVANLTASTCHNTDTGEMEASDNSASSRVHMIMQPGTRSCRNAATTAASPARRAKAAKAPAAKRPH